MRFTLTGLCAAGLVLAMPLAASAISLTDYKFPESTSQQAYLNGSFSSQNSNASNQVGYNLGATGTYDFNHRSLPFTWEFHTLGSATAARAAAADSLPKEDSKGGYRFRAETSANKYRSDTSDFFTYGRTTMEFRAAVGLSPDEPFWDVAAGIGVGRTIDATVLKQAIRMNEDFRQYGLISSDIPDDAMLELAGIIDRKAEYETRYGNVEYRKYWYEDMEEVVRRSGVMKTNSLGALGVIRIQEVLDEPTGRRYYGWDLRGGLGVKISNFGEGDDGEGDIFGEALLNWSRPAGLQLQVNDNASVSTTFVSDPVYTLSNTFQVYYEISNRIDWDNRLNLRYDAYTASGLPDPLYLELSSSYIFYIANRLNFNPAFVYRYTDPGTGSDNPWDWAITAGISYRLR